MTTDNTNPKNQCPNEEELRSFSENSLSEPELGRILAHVAGCEHCRSTLRDLSTWLERLDGAKCRPYTIGERFRARTILSRARNSPSDADAWQFIRTCLQPRPELLAAADGQTADQLQTENATRAGHIHFLSRTDRRDPLAWHAQLAIPTHPTAETVLRIQVFGSDGRTPLDGTLTFCNQPLRVSGGRAMLGLSEFLSHIDADFIAFQRENAQIVPGEPVLGYDLMN